MTISTPTWVKHAVFYQIFPDRLAIGSQAPNRLLKNPTWEDWSAPPTQQGYKGGDLWGVIEKLDYLQNLGINAIYFTPIFQSTCNHRYHTHDYYQVDPILGGNKAFMQLLEQAHQRDIKVVLDGVFNHASRGFFFFSDILENGPNSPWVDWFKINDWPLSAYDGNLPANYEGWVDNRALPVFNHANPDVKEYIMQIAEHWIGLGVDGWRLDVPFEITIEGFWQEFRDRVKAINPEAYIVGEIWHDASHWLDGTQFDGVMNYLFTAPTIAFAAGDRVVMEYVQNPSYEPYPPLSAAAYATKIQALLDLYPWEIQLAQLNLLASHDTARLMSLAQSDRASVELATLLLLTFPGAVSIYYGDEVGLAGAIDPDSRRGFPPESDWDLALLDYHRQLIALRHAYPALRVGTYHTIYAQGDAYAFVRSLDAVEIVVVVNVGTAAVKISLNLAELGCQHRPERQLFGTSDLSWSPDRAVLTIDLAARSGCILN
ncbi:glycoside hydrolase family 13 protein [Chamaesiphon sp.]|uniref:glycoside hydrolase family 13 protein n=1 Tax=Chamaesiphon sp. TaxID=2814140 RepID=UPI003594315D